MYKFVIDRYLWWYMAGLTNCKNIEDSIVKPQCEIKILGITIDFKLKFDSHVSELCRKAARQLNAATFLKTNIDEETRMEI